MGTNGLYTESHELFRDQARRFFETEVVPHYARWEEEKAIPRGLWHKAGAAGLLCPTVPEEYGGAGADYLYNAVLLEEMMRAGAAGLAGLAVHNDVIVPYLVRYGSEDQKREWLPKMVSGEAYTAIGMTEPDAGSDLQAMRTHARKDGNHYVINGQKTYISNGHVADMVLLACKTDRAQAAKGISLIIVELDRAGVRRGRKLRKVGQNAGDSAELFFEDVRVPATNMVGEEGQGFYYMMENLPQERVAIAVMAVAHAAAALGWTLDFVKGRKAFGQTVFDFQNTKFKLAELKTEITVGRTLPRSLPGTPRGRQARRAHRGDVEILADRHGMPGDRRVRAAPRRRGLYVGIPDRARLCGRPRPAHIWRHQRDHEADHSAFAVGPALAGRVSGAQDWRG